MARKKTMSTPRNLTSEDESKDVDEEQAPQATGPETPRKMSKTDAIRAAVAEGIESPGDGVNFIRDRFGLEMSKGHFSATKSKLKSMEAVGVTKAGAPKAAPEAAAKARPEPVQDDRAPTERPAGGEGDLLDALEQMKPLVASLGKEQVKRMVDLLG